MSEPKNPLDYVEMKISQDEVTLFHELLNIETVLQVKAIIESTSPSGDKVVNVVTAFDDFRSFSDKLLFLKTDIRSIFKNMPSSTQTTIVITKLMLNALSLLCAHSSSGIIPGTQAEKLWSELGSSVVNKINTALGSPSITYEEAQKKSSEETEDSSFRINVLNNKAMA